MKKTPHPYFSTRDRRKAIADAACQAIAEKGFEGLRTRDIARKVGINSATLHYHVPTKDALVEFVASSLAAEFAELHIRNPRAGLGPVEQLRLEFSEYRETLRTRPVILQAMGELTRRAQHDPAVARHIDPINAAWRSQFAAILRRGIEEGQFRSDLDIEAATHLIIGAMVTVPNRGGFNATLFDKVEAEALRALLLRPSDAAS